ncbi:MAG: tripartite tricarboxylate transporter substrate binding protein [Thermodesulfobacteriota bacterium]|nr:tripartite tricarboxylate transporter substrate binding protein [Thermodesulfobacteriota bacterium]
MKRDDRQLRNQGGLLVCVAIFSLLLLMAVDGKAADPSADYPSRPIDYVCHTSPGGSMDVLGRLVANIIQKEKILSQPMVVLNKPGSGGAVALGYVLERKGNPHLVLGVTSSTFHCTPLLEKLPYNYKSFVPIANLISEGSVLAVRSDSPFKTMDDIIAEARKRPKELTQGGGSFTSNESMMGLSIQKAKGVKWNFLSFAGGEPEYVINVLNGNVHFILANPAPLTDHVRAGKLRVILAAAPTRYPQFKDAPTMTEAGMGEPILTYRGLVGPPNMPDYAVKKLEVAFRKVMDNDQFKKYMEDNGMLPTWMSPDEFSKFNDKASGQFQLLLSELNLLKK